MTITELQRSLLEKILEDKDISQYLPDDLKSDGVAEILGTSVQRDYDRPDLFEISLKFKVRPAGDETEEKSGPGLMNEYRPDVLSNLSSLSAHLKAEHRPFLFTVNGLENIMKRGQERRLPLPAQVVYKCDSNGNHLSMGLFDFKGYWGMKDENLEMALFPSQNFNMLGDDSKRFLEGQYQHQTHMMHYNNGLDLPNLPLINNCMAALTADRSPFIIVRIDKRYIFEGYEEKTVSHADDAGDGEKVEPATAEGCAKEFPKIYGSSDFKEMYKFTLDRTIAINRSGLLTAPAGILKQYLGKQDYKMLDNGRIDDFMMRYTTKDGNPDMALIPRFNLDLLKKMDEATGFLAHFEESFDTQIRVYGSGTKVIVMTIPHALRSPGTNIHFQAESDFYIRMKKV